MPSRKNNAVLPLLCAMMPILLALTVFAAPGKPIAPQPIRYNRDIRPILAENCFSCHGPDSAARRAGLRLDRFVDAVAQHDGKRAIVPGDPIASVLVERILKPDSDHGRMPPVAGHDRLSAAQTRTLIQWIADGARYERHWAYIPPHRPALPAVKNGKWVRDPIDRFVLARLEAAGLSPAPEADRRTLARRLSLDLTGLPPEPADVERFVGDKSPGAYEKLVDRYLASPRWGEHRGRYWLDAARYADTHGIHFDNYREMWSYRDWVIDAFNRNMPFNTFSIEQLAGDLLPEPTMEQRIATGFNRCNITTNEGGSIDDEVAVLYTRDRTETASQVFLATTAGCAVCHDHKFDPLSQKEMYSLAAFFNNTTQKAMDGNIKDTPPVIPVPRKEDRARWVAVKAQIAQAEEKANRRKTAALPAFATWLSSADPSAVAATIPRENLLLNLPLNEGRGSAITAIEAGKPAILTATAEPAWETGRVAEKAFLRRNGSTVSLPAEGDFENTQSFTCAAWVKLTPGAFGAVVARMDDKNDFRGWDMWVEGNRVGTHIISQWPVDAVKVVTRDPIPAGEWHHVSVTYNGGMTKESIQVYVDGVARVTDAQADALKGTIRTAVPLKIGQRSSTSGMDGTAIQDVRLYGRALSPEDIRRLAGAGRTAYLIGRGAALTAPEKNELFAQWLTDADTKYKALRFAIAAQTAEEATLRQRGTVAYVAQERSEEAMAYVLFRGEYDKRRDPVKAATPAYLPPMPATFPKNRLGFAKWLFLPEHPLTARVTVNRFWQETFGTGLVRTAEDFGIAGEQPSHPELLDYLATDFRDNGWNIKRFFRRIVLSATYRQAAVVTPLKKRRDPQNRLLSRGPRFRMDAEMVRDYALTASGLLVDKRGGPSVKPYQPNGVWESVTMIGSDTREYKQDTGENLYRRSLYTFWKRSAPPTSLDIFNAPSRETCTLRRERTNTPLQALVTLNDTQFIEAARHLAQRALQGEGGMSDAKRLDFLARRLLARSLETPERVILESSLNDLMDYYKDHPNDGRALIGVGESEADTNLPPAQLAAWTMLTNQMMNLDEVLNQ